VFSLPISTPFHFLFSCSPLPPPPGSCPPKKKKQKIKKKVFFKITTLEHARNERHVLQVRSLCVHMFLYPFIMRPSKSAYELFAHPPNDQGSESDHDSVLTIRFGECNNSQFLTIYMSNMLFAFVSLPPEPGVPPQWPGNYQQTKQ